jgi:hypothetical protein
MWQWREEKHVVLQEITDHKSDKTAVHITNGYVMSKQGVKIPKKTTKGWKLLGHVCYVKDSNPIELAEYAVANRIQEMPALKW